MRWRLQILVLAALAAANANAYYFWTHYTQRTAPYNPVPEKFDLTVLPNSTVTFYVTDTGPALFAANDSFAAVLSQIRQATVAWNSVSTSSLRVAFGGVFSAGTPQTTPGGQVIFEQLPPGVLGLGGVSAMADISTSPNRSFYPIITGLMHLTRDLTQLPGPSYTDFFFLDVVHEMGHSLGLQHTFTASAMSQAATRNTTLARIIDADDVAGISVLYPASNFSGQFGSITGRVLTTAGQPVHLASVVAIRAGASPVSAFTNPDGTYRIDGIPPGSYFIYTHPLPPTGDVVYPIDATGNPLAPSAPFTTQWYPGTPGFGTEVAVPVSTGTVLPNINFSVTPRASVPLYDIKAYSYINGNYVPPAYVNENSPAGTGTAIAFGGVGLGTNGVATPGLGTQILGGAATIYSTTAYGDSAGDTFFAMYMYFGLGNPSGPQHLVFTLPAPDNYSYVLANGVNLTFTGTPTINTITGNSDGSVTLTGTNFASDSRFYFDGAPLTVRTVDTVNGIAIAVPPTGASGQHATAMVVNDDGQSSFLVQSANPATFTYPAAATPGLFVAPASLPAGVEAMVDIQGSNTNFVQGVTSVGFGSSDVYVRQVFVLTPTHLQVNVFIPANATQTFTEVNVMTGFQSATLPGGFQITAANPRLPVTSPYLTNSIAGQTSLYPGAVVSIFGSNLSAGPLPAVTFNGVNAPVIFASASQVNLQIPASLQPGVVAMQLVNGLGTSFPVDVTISAPPSNITSFLNAAGVAIDSTHPAHVGDVISMLVPNFADPTIAVAVTRVQLAVNGVSAAPLIVTAYGSGTNVFQIQTAVPPVLSGGQPVAVYLDGRLSAQGTLFIQ
ncbi:MAG TPA: carboxypeptidase regulatory-like domain-containing protein [Bryobacteraceae bacterium]|jgi:uncharacterized protein (TIGR03437 family)